MSIYLKIERFKNKTVEIEIDTFNDISLPQNIAENLPKNKRTQFNSVEFIFATRREIFHRSRQSHKEEFRPDEYGRPHFASKVSFDNKDGDKVKLIFDITNIHNLRDKHLWYFEQLSTNLRLVFDNQSDYPHSAFKLILNHPDREAIELENKEQLDDDGMLKEDYVSIDINRIFFPYQGFELQWNIDKE